MEKKEKKGKRAKKREKSNSSLSLCYWESNMKLHGSDFFVSGSSQAHKLFKRKTHSAEFEERGCVT